MLFERARRRCGRCGCRSLIRLSLIAAHPACLAGRYYPQPGQNVSEPIGYIDEVSNTYAYFEAT